MFSSSCKKLISIVFLLSLLFSSCTTVDRGGKTSVECSYLFPKNAEVYVAGDSDSLPAEFFQMLKKGGVPEKIMECTSRYSYAMEGDKYSVLLEGDYSSLPVKTFFSTDEGYANLKTGTFPYFKDKKTDECYFIPDKKKIFYTNYDIENLLSSYPDKENSFVVLEDNKIYQHFLDSPIYMYMKNPFVPGLNINLVYSLSFSGICCDDGRYLVDAFMIFDSQKQARIISPLVKMFLIKRNWGECEISVEENSLVLKNMRLPRSIGVEMLDYFIWEIYCQ